MGRPPDERLTPATAQEACVRLSVKAMTTREIASLGSHYIVTLKAVNCQSGETIASQQVEASSEIYMRDWEVPLSDCALIRASNLIH